MGHDERRADEARGVRRQARHDAFMECAEWIEGVIKSAPEAFRVARMIRESARNELRGNE
jgi:hypothetical protein